MHEIPWADCRETHLSAVFMAGEHVLKLKKPVKTEFIDFTSLAARDAACEDEVRLNSRLSPDVYLGVARVGLGDQGPGEPMVVMRRLRDSDQLGERIRAADPNLSEHVREVARSLAVFHGECDIHATDGSPGSWEPVRQRWLDECAQIALLGDAVADRPTRTLIQRLGLSYLDGRRPLFDARLRGGQVREGHGDLRCEHVYLTSDGVRILDCVEFDADLRIADVLSDVAFLAMDLERLDAAQHATGLLDYYAELSATTYPASLLDFYIAYRAMVRAKVGAIRAQQTRSVDLQVARYVEIATRHLQRLTPVMMLVGGLPGSGKSTLSEVYARDAGAVHLSSDEIRHGMMPQQRSTEAGSAAWETGGYTPAVTAKVYDELLRRAATALSEGCSVVLDASWHDAQLRDRAHNVARQHLAIPIDVRCDIDERTAFRRLSRTRSGFSQAGVQTREAMKSAFAPWPDAAAIDTDREVADVVPEVERLVSSALAKFGG